MTSLMGPFTRSESLYLNPLLPSALQNAAPAGNVKDWEDGVIPLSEILRIAPPVIGFPVRRFGLACSFALKTTFLRVASTPGWGSFTSASLPSRICSGKHGQST